MIYCQSSECDLCAGIGEVLTDAGIRECTTCHGGGRRACEAYALSARFRKLQAETRCAAALAWLGICLGGISILVTVVHMILAPR